LKRLHVLRADWTIATNLVGAVEAVHFQVGDSICDLGGRNADYVGVELKYGGNWNRTRGVIAPGRGCSRLDPFLASAQRTCFRFQCRLLLDIYELTMCRIVRRRALMNAMVSVKRALGIVVLMLSTSGFAEVASFVRTGSASF
jgi:hypothetical protein